MIHEFIESWHLFWPGWVSAWVIAALLPLVGVPLLARRQVFLGATAAQAAGLGVVYALWLGTVLVTAPVSEAPPPTPQTNAAPRDPLDEFMQEEGIPPEPPPPVAHVHQHAPGWMQSDLFRLAVAVLFAVLACFAGAAVPGDAVLGLVFLAASAGAVLLAGFTPHGMREVQRLLGSTLITATPLDAALLAALCACGVALLVAYRRALVLWTIEPDVARAHGLNTRLCGGAYLLFAGVALGASMYAAGLTYTFACLLLPLLFARAFARSLAVLLWLAPVCGVSVAVAATVLAHGLDLPPGPLFAAMMAALAGLGLVLKRA